MIEEYVKQYAEREREIKQQASNKIIPRKCINCVKDVTQSQLGYFNAVDAPAPRSTCLKSKIKIYA